MRKSYQTMKSLLLLIDEPQRTICLKILHDNRQLFIVMPGSSHNHHVWAGGYYDHICDGMNYLAHLYEMTSHLRPLPFSLSDALLVFFLHDIEKPWRFRILPSGELETVEGLDTKEKRKKFREQKLAECGLVLTEAQQNALTYVEGEYTDYSPRRRVMNELAAMCHMADTWSARGWYDYPAAHDDPWPGAKRINS